MMKGLLYLQAALLAVLQTIDAAPAVNPLEARAPWPDLPFKASGRDIVSASGAKVVYAGVNWPGAADTMLPEGLQYSSVAGIVDKIKSLNMNVVRLTFAIEMIDDIYSNSPDQTLQATLVKALGQTNGTRVLNQILSKNPDFTPKMTRLQVFDAVAAGLAKKQIWVHLDNHVSKAEWCCGTDDGNAWFGGECTQLKSQCKTSQVDISADKYFDPAKWMRGLGYMAQHVSYRDISITDHLC